MAEPKYIDVFVGPADESGNVPLVYVHTDKIDLTGFGRREAPKVSYVHFDEEKQEWYALLLDGREIARGPTRSGVVEAEAAVISEMIARGEPVPGAPSFERCSEWSPEDSVAALAQGWEIFETSRGEDSERAVVVGKPYGYRPFELQAVDDDEIFPDDFEAWQFVRQQFAEDVPLAHKAAAFLKKHSPVEYEAIFGELTP